MNATKVVQGSAENQSQTQSQENTSVETQIQSCNRLIETLITKNSKLEKRMKEMELNFSILCVTLIVSLTAVFIIFSI